MITNHFIMHGVLNVTFLFGIGILLFVLDSKLLMMITNYTYVLVPPFKQIRGH